MINQNSDMFLATDITENWFGTETAVHSIDIRPYITLMDMYGNDGEYNDSYNNKATVKDGVLTSVDKNLRGKELVKKF